MSGYPREKLKAVTGKFLKFGAMLGTAMLLVLIAGAGQPVHGQTYSVLHDFNLDGSDGIFPGASVVRDQSGNLYGTTRNGGTLDGGTVFKIDSSGNEAVLHSFSNLQGYSPYGGVILDASGNLYGTTAFGGAHGDGTVFMMDPSGNETVLHSFSYSDGGFPFAGVVRDQAGNLYGTTVYGGALGMGTVFKIDASGNEMVLHNFAGGSDGANPFAGVILDQAGNLYGATYNGGASSLGTVFKVDTSGNETVLYSLTGGSDGANPYGGLALDSTGNVYGTTYNGGASGLGTVFKVGASGSETVLRSFDSTDGANPYGSVSLDGAGNLYGTAFEGGDANVGTVFKISPSGIITVLHNFDATGGGEPYAGVTLDSAGNLYGTAFGGGTFGYGTVFKITQVVPFAAFDATLNLTSGFQLQGDFVQGPGGPAIDPTVQGMTVTVGSYSVTVPASAFRQIKPGDFITNQEIGGVMLYIHLQQTGTNAYHIQLHASPVDLSSSSDPVPVTLTFGENSGTIQVNTSF